jgi:hypothetical protein
VPTLLADQPVLSDAAADLLLSCISETAARCGVYCTLLLLLLPAAAAAAAAHQLVVGCIVVDIQDASLPGDGLQDHGSTTAGERTEAVGEASNSRQAGMGNTGAASQ